MKTENNKHKKNPNSKYRIALILGTISIVILSFYLYNEYKTKESEIEKIPTQNKNSNKNKTFSTPDTTANKTKDVLKLDANTSKNNKHYLEILKKHLEETNKNDDVKVYVNENGDLKTEDSNGNFLSVYELSHAEIFSGDINDDGKSETVIQIANSGAGGGGNIVLIEIYLIDNEGIVSEIDKEIINPPKNEFGYTIYLTGIVNDFVTIDFVFRNEDDGFYALGKIEKLKCKLINNKLRVEN